MSPFLRRLLKWIAIALGTMVVLIIAVLIAFRVAMTRVPEYRERLQAWLNERTGLVIEFRDLHATWRLYGPEIVFEDSVLRTADRRSVIATTQRGSVGLDIWGVFTTGRLNAGRFELDGAHLSLVRTEEGRIQIVGQSASTERDTDHPYDLDRMPTGTFTIKNAEVSFRDEVTRRGPWQFTNVTFELRRRAQELHVKGEASLPRMLGNRLRFSADSRGRLADPQSLESRFAVEGSGLDLGGLGDVLPDSWPSPEAGIGDLSVSGRMTGPRLDQLAARVGFDHVSLVLPQWSTPLPQAAPLVMRSERREDEAVDDPPVVAPVAESIATSAQPALPKRVVYDRLAMRLEATRVDDAWRLEVNNLQLDRKQARWAPSTINAQWTRNDNGALSLRAQADQIVLSDLWPLLAFAPESATLARVRALDASGSVRNIKVTLNRGPADDASALDYSLDATAENLGFAPIERAPGVRGVSGVVTMTAAGGEFDMASRKLQFSLPRLFRDSLTADSVDATFKWARGDSGWRVSTNDLRLANADGKVTAKMALQLPRDGTSPLIELTADASDIRAEAATRYMPAGSMTPKTLEWLDRAFVAGRVPEANLDLRGPLRNFPFRDGSGLFLIDAKISGLTVNYQPGWTPTTDADLTVEFRNEGMTGHIQTAQLGGLTLQDITGGFRDFRNSELRIHGAATGDLGDALKYLQWSPIGPVLGEQFLSLKGNGSARMNMDLLLPLKKLADRKIQVDAHLANATVIAGFADAPVSQLNGDLSVHQSLLDSAHLEGRWLNGPVSVAITPEHAVGLTGSLTGGRTAAQAAMLTASGYVDSVALTKTLHLPASINLSGGTDWRVMTRLRTRADDDERAQKQTVSIDTGLRGLAVGLPEPLRKSAGEERPLHVELEFAGHQSILARGAYGPVRALINIVHGQDGWQFDRGMVRADSIAAALPEGSGLLVEGSVDSLNLDDWFAMKGPSSRNRKLSDLLRAANLHVNTVQFLGHEWRDVRGVLQARDRDWQLDVAGPQIAGQLLIPYDFTGTRPLTMKLDKLMVTTRSDPSSGGDPTQSSQDPRNLPAIDATIGDLSLDQHDIGNVELKMTHVADGVNIDSLSVRGASFTTDIHGASVVAGGKTLSSLEMTFSSTDVGATLRSLGYGEFMTAKHADAHAKLSWPGGFDEQLLSRATGDIALRVESGQLLTVQPGAGRVVGLLSVAALPRRLSLDFSDLVDKGLSFDSVRGDFSVKNGNAYTNNLLLSGPAAEIGIAGRTGIAARDYDQTAIVTGRIGSTLPVAGAVIGGPVVGAALLLFAQVFKEPLKGVTRGYYRITGPWDNPIVERLPAAELKDTGARIESSP